MVIGLAKAEKATAAFSAIIGFLLFHVTLGYLLSLKGLNAETTSVAYLVDQGLSALEATTIASRYVLVLSVFTSRMNLFGGIITGNWVAWMHNRFYLVQLSVAINFFGGKRFVPIIVTVTIPILALMMYYIWPFVNEAIVGVGNVIAGAGAIGTLVLD